MDQRRFLFGNGIGVEQISSSGSNRQRKAMFLSNKWLFYGLAEEFQPARENKKDWQKGKVRNSRVTIGKLVDSYLTVTWQSNRKWTQIQFTPKFFKCSDRKYLEAKLFKLLSSSWRATKKTSRVCRMWTIKTECWHSYKERYYFGYLLVSFVTNQPNTARENRKRKPKRTTNAAFEYWNRNQEIRIGKD